MSEGNDNGLLDSAEMKRRIAVFREIETHVLGHETGLAFVLVSGESPDHPLLPPAPVVRSALNASLDRVIVVQDRFLSDYDIRAAQAALIAIREGLIVELKGISSALSGEGDLALATELLKDLESPDRAGRRRESER